MALKNKNKNFLADKSKKQILEYAKYGPGPVQYYIKSGDKMKYKKPKIVIEKNKAIPAKTDRTRSVVIEFKRDTTHQDRSPHILDLKRSNAVPNPSAQIPPDRIKPSSLFAGENKLEKPIGIFERIRKIRTEEEKTQPKMEIPIPKREKIIENESKKKNLLIKQKVKEKKLITFAFISGLHQRIRNNAMAAIKSLVASSKRTAAPVLVDEVEELKKEQFTEGLAKPVKMKKARQPLNLSFLKFEFSLPQNWHRGLAFFAILSFVLVMPISLFSYYQRLQVTRASVEESSTEALNQIKQAANMMGENDFTSASINFYQASYNFGKAREEIERINEVVAYLSKFIPDQEIDVKTGQKILAIGESASRIAKNLSIGISGFQITGSNIGLGGVRGLEELANKLDESRVDIEMISSSLKEINALRVSNAYQEQIVFIQKTFPAVEKSFYYLADIVDLLGDILGESNYQRLLVLFQNNAELRATGGFIGSYALVDIERGDIKKVNMPGGGSYDLQGSLEAKVISPQPMHIINPHWEFQDSNWWPDVPSAFQKVVWFFEKSRMPTPSGVIALNPDVVFDLLPLIGPVDMSEDYGRIINQENFLEIVQKESERKFWETNEPKKFLADLSIKVLKELVDRDQDNILEIMAVLEKHLKRKNVVVYMRSPEVQEKIQNFGWAGEIRETQGDYLMVVHSNISGGKSDLMIKEQISHTAEIATDGTVICEVAINKHHTGKKEDGLYGMVNMDYIRFYVPLGSELISAEGFKLPLWNLFEEPEEYYHDDEDLIKNEKNKRQHEKTHTYIYEESGKTVFGNWMQTTPGSFSEVRIKYRLPFKVIINEPEGVWEKISGIFISEKPSTFYSLLLQKQPGANNSEINSELKIKKGFIPILKYPDNLKVSERGYSFSAEFDQDLFLGLVLSD